MFSTRNADLKMLNGLEVRPLSIARQKCLVKQNVVAQIECVSLDQKRELRAKLRDISD